MHRAGTTDDYTQSGYTVLVRNNGELAVIKAAGNSAVTYLGATPTAARPGTEWVTVTVRLDGDRLDVSLGGAVQPLLSVTDSSFDDGGFSLAAHRDLRVVVDSVELTGVAERDEPAPADCIAWSGEPASDSSAVSCSTARSASQVGLARKGRARKFQSLRLRMELLPWPRHRDGAHAGTSRRSSSCRSSTTTPPRTGRRAMGFENDANTAYQLALAYRLTGEESYGSHAAQFIDAWMSTVDCVRTSEDSALAFSYHFPAFVFAAELLRGTPVWSEQGERAFAGFLAETATPVAGSILHRSNNWGSWALELTAASAAYLDDATAIQAAYTRATELTEHQIDANGHMPEEVTRNNGVGDYGIWYTHFSLLPLLLTAETLAAHGFDLHSYVNANGTGLADAVEAASSWGSARESFPYYSR